MFQVNKETVQSILLIFNLRLCHLGGLSWAPTHTPAPRIGSTLAAISIGTTKTCQKSTDKQPFSAPPLTRTDHPRWERSHHFTLCTPASLQTGRHLRRRCVKAHNNPHWRRPSFHQPDHNSKSRPAYFRTFNCDQLTAPLPPPLFHTWIATLLGFARKSEFKEHNGSVQITAADLRTPECRINVASSEDGLDVRLASSFNLFL